MIEFVHKYTFIKKRPSTNYIARRYCTVIHLLLRILIKYR